MTLPTTKLFQQSGMLLVLFGCGEPMNAPTDAGTVKQALRGPCALGERVGGFLVEAQTQYSIVDGKVANGVVPASVPIVVQEAGDCVLHKRRNLVCTPSCLAGMTCGENGSCIAFPEQLDVGKVTIAGLQTSVEMSPRMPGASYFETELPHPAFAPGAAIALASNGMPEIELFGVGVDLLQRPDAKLRVVEGQPLAITWNKGDQAVARVDLRLNIDQHGASPVSIRCSFEDDGEAEVPASMIDALFASGVSGFPNANIVRHTTDSMSIADGCVDLVVSSPLAVAVEVAGHQACSAQVPCPMGQRCDLPTNTCKDQ